VSPRWSFSVVTAAGAIVGCGLLLVSCSSAPVASTKTITPGSVVPFRKAQDARSDVKTAGCVEASGAWTMSGSVKNPATTTTGFEIVIDFVTKPGSTVIGTSEVNVANVAPGATASWSATGARGKSEIACIVRLAQTT
jgi:hypothetical protein